MTYQDAQRLAAIFSLDPVTVGNVPSAIIDRLSRDLVALRPHYDEIRGTVPDLLGNLYYDSCRVEIAKARMLAYGEPVDAETERIYNQMMMSGA